eukprot:TRINITY_DN17474_c5_g1_i1.p1 TRINITY_DN17474_c5_g1~~TRINITY_DN17474_c5_g1_i1.p1  ORF type:complete len:370 (+),score=36.08 TRINITY_DN17474_c5_g1_i1:50-1159(+)
MTIDVDAQQLAHLGGCPRCLPDRRTVAQSSDDSCSAGVGGGGVSQPVSWKVPRGVPLEEVDCRSLRRDDFSRRLVATRRPVILRGVARNWRCCTRWRWPLLSRLGSDRQFEVSVAIGTEESSTPTTKALLPFDRLVDMLSANAASMCACDECGVSLPPRPDIGNAMAHCRVAAEGSRSSAPSGTHTIPYLKQVDLLETFPELIGDVHIERLWSRWATVTTNVWMGPDGAVTGLHEDDEDNVAVAILGRKQFVLFPPEQGPVLAVNSKYDSGTRCCDVEPFAPDFQKHPRYIEATPLVGILQPGDGIFIPRGWWHTVRSLDTTLSINMFASSPWELVRYGSIRLFFWILHVLGLYKRGNCVCHANRLLKI